MCDTHSEQINELAKALAAAQGELEPAEKNSTAAVGKEGKLKRKYADLTAMIDAVRKVLPKHGLSIAQIVLPTEGVAHVRTMLMHESGQWLASECRMPYDNTGSKNTVQSMGSAITYARRYSLSALVGVAGSLVKASRKKVCASSSVMVISSGTMLSIKPPREQRRWLRSLRFSMASLRSSILLRFSYCRIFFCVSSGSALHSSMVCGVFLLCHGWSLLS